MLEPLADCHNYISQSHVIGQSGAVNDVKLLGCSNMAKFQIVFQVKAEIDLVHLLSISSQYVFQPLLAVFSCDTL